LLSANDFCFDTGDSTDDFTKDPYEVEGQDESDDDIESQQVFVRGD
jgi:hypothetical protein